MSLSTCLFLALLLLLPCLTSPSTPPNSTTPLHITSPLPSTIKHYAHNQRLYFNLSLTAPSPAPLATALHLDLSPRPLHATSVSNEGVETMFLPPSAVSTLSKGLHVVEARPAGGGRLP